MPEFAHASSRKSARSNLKLGKTGAKKPLKIIAYKLRLGAQSVTLLSTLRDPTQLRRLKFLLLIRRKI